MLGIYNKHPFKEHGIFQKSLLDIPFKGDFGNLCLDALSKLLGSMKRREYCKHPISGWVNMHASIETSISANFKMSERWVGCSQFISNISFMFGIL